MRKKEMKRRIVELEKHEATHQVQAAQMEKLGAYEITGRTAYVSAPDPYVGLVAVMEKLIDADPSPTTLVITSQYVPAGADGEGSYFATNGTASI
jgi:hypothetical protein